MLFQIKDLLLSGRLMPGEQLSLRSTAEALGVSVMPVREAVYQLVADQALEVAPNRSVRVPTMTREQFKEITDIRLQIEGYAVEQATLKATPALILSLRSLNETLAREMDAPDNNKASIVMLNKEIHFSIYEAAAMPMLLKIIETLWLRIGPILNYDIRAGSERTQNKIAVNHHIKMIDALEQGIPAEARQALHNDIKGAFDYIYAKQFS
ncbi:GntR family transcriptional regulator [Pollutimonas subterranea]|uniref:GntR family transcriptional regulator n=1 Tax=Pollutimonas subterranea TaxID=2045210 RepID=UPI001E4DF3DC|nr:GntR family transcriptional regulator [Pollutimonas subterranea]